MSPLTDSNLVYRALIVLGLIGFGFYLVADRGLVTLALNADKSYISYVILGLYVLASGHWLWLAYTLSAERRRFVSLESRLESGSVELKSEIQVEVVGELVGEVVGEVVAAEIETEGNEAASEEGLLGEFLANLKKKTGDDPSALLTAFGDELANRHALGQFASDVLLKLGLLGTIVGFILMLLPVGEIEQFDPSLMQQLLSSMSGGMAVALYTTLAGLITSTLLKLQYHILDASAAELATRLAVLTDVHLTRHAA